MAKQAETDTWQFLVNAAKRGVEELGFELEKQPGRGLSNIWTLRRNGTSQSASIRTTRDRWFAFPPLDGGKRWKTLDDVDAVVVAAVDSKERPLNVEVYLFPAKEVRQRFDAAYAARRDAGLIVRDNFGMWVALDRDERGVPASIGSGIADEHKPIAVYSVRNLVDGNTKGANDIPSDAASLEIAGSRVSRVTTIGEVMSWARQRISEIAGVRIEAVRVDLKIEY
jgi:hypothetical protein